MDTNQPKGPLWGSGQTPPQPQPAPLPQPAPPPFQPAPPPVQPAPPAWGAPPQPQPAQPVQPAAPAWGGPADPAAMPPVYHGIGPAAAFAPPAADADGDGEADGGSHRGVALLLAATATVAALVSAIATGTASDAGDAWQSALRTDVQRSAAANVALSSLYQGEVPTAVEAIGLRIQEAQLRTAAGTATGATTTVLTEEADTRAGVLQALGTSVDLTKPDYALPGGGVDLGKRLAAIRAQDPDMVALDPDTIQATGDALAIKAFLLNLALVPLALAALFGALAEPFHEHRRAFLTVGTIALVTGILVAAGIAVLA